MVQFGRHACEQRGVEHAGYIWLFAVSGLFLLRLLFDALMVRRPLLEPNLTVGGLTFLGHFAVRVPDGQRGHGHAGRDRRGRFAAGGRLVRAERRPAASSTACGHMVPAFRLLFLLPQISTQSVLGESGQQEAPVATEVPTAGPGRPSWSTS